MLLIVKKGDFMNFEMLVNQRQSTRSYDANRSVETQKIEEILQAVRLSPSACNGQPYHLTVVRGEKAKLVARATTSMGMNKFALDAPVLIVIAEKPYVTTASLGSKLKNNDYRSIDIGIAVSYLTLKATELGLGTCILGWFEEKEIQKVINTTDKIRLVVTLGYAKNDEIRPKKRKELNKLVTYID